MPPKLTVIDGGGAGAPRAASCLTADEVSALPHDRCAHCTRTRVRCYVRRGVLSAPLCGACLNEKRRQVDAGRGSVFDAILMQGGFPIVPSLPRVDLFAKGFRTDAARAVNAWLDLPEAE